MAYQDRDIEIVDYEMFSWPGAPVALRGPRPELKGEGYVACAGAAQTFGCFCDQPWPSLLSKSLDLPVLNLGVAGAGPRLFNSGDWLELINGGSLAVVQVMSGRSEDNSLFESGGSELLTRRSDGSQIGAEAAWRELFEADVCAIPKGIPRRLANRILGRFGRRGLRNLVTETRANWVASCSALLDAITVPTILLWFSKRAPEYSIHYRNVWTAFGEFPHLIDAEMVAAVRAHADHYVECVTSRGSPQPMISRFTGLPTTIDPGAARADLATGELMTHNSYYPSPEMHCDVEEALRPVVQGVAKSAAVKR